MPTCRSLRPVTGVGMTTLPCFVGDADPLLASAGHERASARHALAAHPQRDDSQQAYRASPRGGSFLAALCETGYAACPIKNVEPLELSLAENPAEDAADDDQPGLAHVQDFAAEAWQHFVPFPPIECLAVVGDRRAAAMVAADGTVCWMCLPRYDATPVFGALLDLKQGGYWRLGPEARVLGEQRYEPGTATLVTRWQSPDGVLELTDCMLWPADVRAEGLAERRVLVRRLLCVSGKAQILHRAIPRENLQVPAVATVDGDAARMEMPTLGLGLWCSLPMQVAGGGKGVHAERALMEGQEVWAVLDSPAEAGNWTIARAEAALRETEAYWRAWSGKLQCKGARADEIRLSAMVVHLLTYAPTGAVIAAPTTCLPERVPGNYNYDYRYCWIRDGSLTISLLAQLGQPEPAGRFLTWVAGLLRPPSDDPKQMPLQVLYRVDGGTKIPKIKRDDIEGYRSCTPVAFGNPVYQMHEIDGFGFLIECALLFAQAGGTLTKAHWTLVQRCVDFIAGELVRKGCRDLGADAVPAVRQHQGDVLGGIGPRPGYRQVAAPRRSGSPGSVPASHAMPR